MTEIDEGLGQEAARGLADQRNAPLVVEHVGRQSREGKDGAIEGDAEQDNVPVGGVELPDIGEDNLVASVRFRKIEHLLPMAVHGNVDQIAQYREEAEACRGPESDAVAAEILGDELLGVETEEGPDAADGEGDAEGQGHLLALEPAADDGALHHDQGFGTRAEYQPSGEELPLGVGEGHYSGAQEDEAAEQQAGPAGAQLVVKHAPKEHDDDGGHGVCSVEIPDRAAVQMQRIDECGREGADAVIGEIAPQYQQADEYQDCEAVRALRWMEEPH